MHEHTRARAAFERYWHLGAERSIERLHDDLVLIGKAPTVRTLYEWSRRFHWQSRIGDLEREAVIADQERHQREAREMSERQLREGLLLQQKGAEWLSGIDPQHVSAAEATKAIVDGAKLEREARGATDAGEAVSPRHDAVRDRLAQLTDEQLQRLVTQIEDGMRHG